MSSITSRRPWRYLRQRRRAATVDAASESAPVDGSSPRPHVEGGEDEARRERLLADYVEGEDALRAFTDRNFGQMCAICARWTLLATQVNARERASRAEHPGTSVGTAVGTADGELGWRVSSWVTNCCNANHALESMSEESLAGIVASREAGQEWWRTVRRAQQAPCSALTATGCHLVRGRPELCNRFFCEAVRDYLWLIGAEQRGAQLAGYLDELQRLWAQFYAVYQGEIVAPAHPRSVAEVRGAAGRQRLLRHLLTFDAALARCARPVTAQDFTERLFKVSGDAGVYEPFFNRELAAIGGAVRREPTGEA